MNFLRQLQTARSLRTATAGGLSLVLGCCLAPELLAQTITDGSGSSSVHYFSEAKSSADGGSAQSATYAATVSIGNLEPEPATSATYVVSGGFPDLVDVLSSAPWLTSASPTFVTPNTQDLVWLTGARMTLSPPTVAVSGNAATVVAQSPTDIAVRLPNLPAPGWHQISLQNLAGTTTLERGIGVLPLLYTEGAPGSNVGFDVIFKGTKGDQIIWAVSRGPGPLFKFGPYLHGLNVDLSVFRILTPLIISANNGELRFPVPAVPLSITAYIQALFITSNPGYSPGSFSNVLKF